MTVPAPDALIARAKELAIPVASRVAARIGPGTLTRDLSRDELHALIIVLAEAADPVLLRIIAGADDAPAVTDINWVLRKAHADATACRRAGKPVTERLRYLDGAYRKRLRLRREAGARRRSPTPEDRVA